MNEEDITKIDFMKIDVQGAEYLVLDGAKEALLKEDKVIQLEVILEILMLGKNQLVFILIFLNLMHFYKFKNFADNIVIKGNLIQSDLFFTV